MTAVLYLVGATASGKKQAAALAAPALGADLLSLDSMKVFRGMDRGTDKSAGPHFALTDLVEPDQPFSVGEYVRHARLEVERIRTAGRRPLFVGGTGLYLRALVRGLFEGPASDPDQRRRLTRRLEREGARVLHAELAQVDPVAARRIHPNDRKRLLRALEVHRVSGRPLTEWQEQETVPPLGEGAVLVGLRWPDLALRRRIEQRVERMFAAGLVEEVRALRSRLGAVAGSAIGYREVLQLLEGELDESRCRQEVVRATWRLARRQATWFRQFEEIEWVDAGPAPEERAARIVQCFQHQLERAGEITP